MAHSPKKGSYPSPRQSLGSPPSSRRAPGSNPAISSRRSSVGSASAPQVSVSVVASAPGFKTCTVADNVVTIVSDVFTLALFDSMTAACEDRRERLGRFGWLGIVEPQTNLTLPDDVRAAWVELVARYSNCFTGAVLVYEEVGFSATVIRSVLTAVNMASRASHPNRVFSSLYEGVRWLSGCSEQAQPPTFTELYSAVLRVREVR